MIAGAASSDLGTPGLGETLPRDQRSGDDYAGPSNHPQRRDVWNGWMLDWATYDGRYELPCLPPCHSVAPGLTAFSRARIMSGDTSFIHFFEDDYRFERIWRQPRRYLPLLKAYGGAVAPDFSVYRDMPLVQQMYNVFRSRCLGYWWSRQGITVVPNVRWGDARTYEFCFDGIPKHSVVAVGTHGCVRSAIDKRYFSEGFEAMLDRVSPTTVIVYGSQDRRAVPPLPASAVEIVPFPSDFARSHPKKGA